MALHVTCHEQKQFKSQKHFNLRLLKSQLSDTLSESNNGSVTVVQCQPHETKGLIKINCYNEKERIPLFSFSTDSCQRAQEIGS